MLSLLLVLAARRRRRLLGRGSWLRVIVCDAARSRMLCSRCRSCLALDGGVCCFSVALGCAPLCVTLASHALLSLPLVLDARRRRCLLLVWLWLSALVRDAARSRMLCSRCRSCSLLDGGVDCLGVALGGPPSCVTPPALACFALAAARACCSTAASVALARLLCECVWSAYVQYGRD